MKLRKEQLRSLHLLVIFIFTTFLWSCNNEKDNVITLSEVTILQSEPILIDRGETIEVLFKVTPGEIIIPDEEIDLRVEDIGGYYNLRGVKKRENGIYTAFIEDTDKGIPYVQKAVLRVAHKNVDGSVNMVESTPFTVSYQPREYEFQLLSDEIVYDSNNHSAFTGLLNFNGALYLAFREGTAHRPSTVEDYGVIKVLSNDGTGWRECCVIKDETKDLRDPFLINLDGKLRMYIGYNTFEEGRYQHSGSVYADFENGVWSGTKTLTHDVPHIVWLWKVRQYKKKYYSVAYLEGEYPALLESTDGITWKTLTFFELEGEMSEADMCFVGNTMYVCIRKDEPVGTPSFWGYAQYPFEIFTWKEMDTCVESPEMLRMPYSNSLLLTGRERQSTTGEVCVSLFKANLYGELTKIATFDSGIGGDKAYPGLTIKDGKLYCSYYTGISTATKVKLATLSISKR